MAETGIDLGKHKKGPLVVRGHLSLTAQGLGSDPAPQLVSDPWSRQSGQAWTGQALVSPQQTCGMLGNRQLR